MKKKLFLMLFFNLIWAVCSFAQVIELTETSEKVNREELQTITAESPKAINYSGGLTASNQQKVQQPGLDQNARSLLESPENRNDFRANDYPTGTSISNPAKGQIQSDQNKKYPSHIVVDPSDFRIHTSIDNDKKPVKEEVAKSNTKGWNLIMTEDFEGSFPSGSWSSYAPSGYADVYWDDASCRSNNGSWSGFVGDLGSQSFGCGENYVDNMKSIMQYGPFDLSDAEDAYMSYYWWANTETDFDKLSVYASVDGTNFWGWYWTGDHTSWNQYTFDLTDVYNLGDLTGYEEVWIAFFFESDGSYSVAEGAYIDDIELWKDVNSGYQDLELSGGGFSPNPIYTNGTLTIDAEIYNAGTAAASGSEVEYYLSTDQDLDDGDYYLGNDYAYIDPGATGYESISVDLNNNVSPGDYYVFVNFVDEGNWWWWNTTLEVLSVGAPDLELTGGGFSPNPIYADGTLTIDAEIYNNGTAAASGVLVEYYLSTDQDLDDNDIYLGNDYAYIDPGATGYESITVDLNNVADPGNYYVFVNFADEGNWWWWNTTLEVLSSGNQDLQLSGGGFSPNPIAEDATLSINAELYNNGSAGANNSEIYYCLSTDDTYDAGDAYLGNDFVTLGPGETATESISVDLNNSVNPGTYYVLVYFVDQGNNWYWYEQLEVVSAGVPDIDISPSSITVNESGKSSATNQLTPYDLKPKPPISQNIMDTIINPDGTIIYGVRVPGVLPPKDKQPIAVPTKAAVILGNVPAFSWSFGCSATAAAMAAGHYDNTGYPNMYAGPTNGGVCPMDNSSWPGTYINGEYRAQCPLSATRNGIDGRTTRGHVDDYWISYGSTESDPWITNGWTEHSWGDCTGDYMGTNQSSYGNTDASTTFYFNPNGAPLEDYSACEPSAKDGCHGLREFYESRGYNIISNYTQLIYGYDGNSQGYTLAEFQAEIDAGRTVLIHVTGHTMLATGYENDGSGIIYIHDTWDYNQHSMVWGESYSGMQHWGMTSVQLEESSTDYDFTILNTGTSNLSVTSISDNAAWLSLSGYPSLPFSLSAGNTAGINININWSTVGSSSQTAQITVQSNDPDESSVVVTVTAIPDQDYYLSVSPSNRNVTSSSGSTSFSVSSNTSWTVSDNASWISVSPNSGTNNGTISATYSENNGAERVGTITVYGNGTDPYQVTITQEEAAPTPYLNVNPDYLNIASGGGSATFNISSNVSWNISENASWLSVTPSSGSNNGSVSVNCSANAGSQRTAIITISGSGVTSQTVEVTQAAASSGTLVFVNPDIQTVNTSETFSTTIEIADVSNLGSFELNVDFAANYLQANSVTLEGFLGSTGRQVFPLTNNINNSLGLIEFAATTLGASLPGASGDGVLLSIEWTAVASINDDVTTYLLIENLQVTDPTGTVIPSSIQNGTVIISSCYPKDFDCDCDVDIVDVTMAAYAYGTETGDENYDAVYDLDSDGDVDIVDITMVTYDYGWSCDDGKSAMLKPEEVDNENCWLALDESKLVDESNGIYEQEVIIENISDFGGVEVELEFDPDQIDILEVNTGDFIKNSNREMLEIQNSINNNIGYVTYATTGLGFDEKGEDGNLKIVKVRYQRKTERVSSIAISSAQIVRPNAEIIPFKLKQSTLASSKNQILSVYPSPTKNDFTVEFTLLEESDIQIMIYDIYGKRIHKKECGNVMSGINQSLYQNIHLESGMYQIALIIDGKLNDIEKLIIY